MRTTVIYHSADYDGIFCREIARKFLPDAELIGWNFGDAPVPIPKGLVYVLDLPVDRVLGFDFANQLSVVEKFESANAIKDFNNRLVWIDHHKTSINTHPKDIPGYRIDGVAACRLAWHWFTNPQLRHSSKDGGLMPSKIEFVERELIEPLAVRLAGEYDIWDKHDPRAETFQYALGLDELVWKVLLDTDHPDCNALVGKMLVEGQIAQRYARKTDADLVKHRSYRMNWEGLNWLVLNTGRFNSLTFAALDVPETGHDALLGYMFNGKVWTVSLYHAKHRTDLDLSEIAKRYGGGGHRGACGFTRDLLPFHSLA